MTRRRKPAEALFGFRCLFTPGPGETWTTDIRFTSFNSDWICAVEWRGAFNDRSENTSLPVILGFANRRDLYRSTMLLLSQPREWWWFPSGQAEIYPAGRKRPPPHYLKAIQICCRRDGSSSRMECDDDEQSSSWAEVTTTPDRGRTTGGCRSDRLVRFAREPGSMDARTRCRHRAGWP